MKLKNLLIFLASGFVLAMFVAGCHTQPEGSRAIRGDRSQMTENTIPTPIPPPFIPPPMEPKDISFAPTPGHTNYVEDPNSPLGGQTIHFEYDKTAIKKNDQPRLEEVASYMKGHGEVVVRVEGNCDERGTEEYNRALGERRALAAREYLVRLGIDPSRIDTITFGEDKPVAASHDEAAWGKNRRDDFVVLLPPKA